MLRRIFGLLLVTALMAWCQATSSLHGTVTDPSGAVMPDAAVTIQDEATGTARKTVSDKDGNYQFAQVAPGKYTVSVEKPGFTSLVQTGLVLAVNTPATLDCKLEIGAVGATVQVEAEAATINTVDASTGNPFNQMQVRQLPLQTRNVVELLSIQPGVTQNGEVLGARRDQNNITLDGVDVNDNQNSGIKTVTTNGNNTGSNLPTAGFNSALPVPLDSVQEFRVTVGGVGANQGRSSGGQVSLVTKSGTNEFHGSLYEFNRNTALAANDWFNNRSGNPRTPLVRNQYGVSLGGPVKKDRLFFFANWEHRTDASGQVQTVTLPSETLKQGTILLRANDGSIQTLNAADIIAIDPLHLGYSSAMRSLLTSYPVGNDPTLGTDKGLNFSGLRFNAPYRQSDNVYVAKMDANLDRTGNHTLSVRGTLAGLSQPNAVAQFPGQQPASLLLNNSRGISGRYTWVVRPTLVNTFNYGLTRIGMSQSGTTGASLSFDSISSFTNFGVRPFVRISPTHNITDDITWTKGSHSIQAGINFRFIRNNRSTYSNSYPSYSFSRNTLLGLGGDLTPVINSYLQTRSGNPNLAMSDSASVVRAFGNLLGIINQYSANYQYTTSGSTLPFGTPATRQFSSNEYEGYIQDSWRVKRNLTLNFGVRYSLFGVPSETQGIQVVTTVGLDQYYADRVGAMMLGIPNNRLSTAALTYALGGPANGRSGWYSTDKNNFGPRFSFAYNPEFKDGWLSKFLGKGSVLRGGAAVVFDRYGSDMITYLDQSGSPGLVSNVTQPNNTNFTTSARYNGSGSLPTLPAAPAGGFPFTPPTITGGFNQGVGISPDLVAPYSIVLNMNYARELPGKITVEAGYAGRLSRKNLLQADFDQPLTQFKDQASGQTWTQASGILRSMYDAGVTPAMVKANPSLVGKVGFFENMFPALTNLYFPGSATANYFDVVYRQNAGSDLDGLNQLDRSRTNAGFPNCITKTGCNTFFPLQMAGMPTWTNWGFSNYNAATLTVRRPFANGVSFDFNYTLSHSIDNSSGSESGASTSGAILQDSFSPSAFRGSSDFDIRHNITANVLFNLPVGRNAQFFNGMPVWADTIVGGWQISMISRYRSGMPTTITNSGVYPTNYENSALAIRRPGTNVQTSIGLDQNGLPSLFANTNAANGFVGQYPGQTGARALVRLPGMTNFDLALAKVFTLPWEHHRLQFRAEAFNAFNNVNFYNPSLSLTSPARFGEFQNAMPARVMQLSLRYEF